MAYAQRMHAAETDLATPATEPGQPAEPNRPAAGPKPSGTSPEQADSLVRRVLRWADTIKREAGKFGTVGITVYLLDSGLFTALALTFGEQHSTIAKIISGAVATTAAFFANRYWTWRDRAVTNLKREYVVFVVINVFGLLIQLSFMWLSKYGLGHFWPKIFHTVAADFVASNIIGMGFATIFRFWAYRTFVFLKPETEQ